MRRLASFSLVIALYAALFPPAVFAVAPSTGAATLTRGANHSADELLVKFRAGVSDAQANALTTAQGALRTQRFVRPNRLRQAPIDSWRAVKLGRGTDLRQVRATLLRNPLVEQVEYNYEVRIALTPNDPSFSALWGLNNVGQTGGTPNADINAPEAWDQATGNGSVVVAVIDTGVDYTHPDLAANVWTNPGEIPGNGLDDDGNGYVDDVYGYDFYNFDANPMDDHGHGTHVAGTIAAVGNNGVGVAGVTWNARIMAVKFLGGGGGGSTSGAISAVLYAANMGAKVLNNSWGGGGFSQALLDAIRTADQAGALFVAAAGNNGTNNDTAPHYPSNYDAPNVVSVAATDHNDLRAGFSNFGAQSVDLGAPGASIFSTVPPTGSACCSNPSGYMYLSGTSMATPHVAGAAALLMSRFPGSNHYQARDRLLSMAQPIPALAGITVTGGRLNVLAAMEPDDIAPAAVFDLISTEVRSRRVTLRWSATGDDGFAGSAWTYDLRYAQVPITEANFAQATPVSGTPKPAAPGTPETFQVTGLNPNSDYFFALRVRDNVGNASPLSNLVGVRTSPVITIFQDNMESGAGNWTIAGSNGVGGPALWHLSTHRANSPSTAFYYGRPTTFNYDTGARNFGSITSAPISLVGVTGSALSFAHFLQTENLSPYDSARVQISVDNGATWTDIYVTSLSTNGMVTRTADLSTYDNNTIRLRFSFDTVDGLFNAFEGWVVDDVVVSGEPQNSPPTANPGGPYSGYRNQSVTFSGHMSSDPNGDPLTYAWDFGDGTSGTGVAPTHAYTAYGSYTVTLVVNDGVYNSAPVSTTVTIFNRSPSANPGGPYSGYRNQAIAFNGAGSSDPDGDPLTYEWDFGDGTSGTGPTPTHAYAASGTYNVRLLVHDGYVGSYAVFTTATVSNRVPVVNPGGPYTGYRNEPIVFNGSGTDSDGDALLFSWNFGDGTSGSGTTVSHAYTALGSYTATLTANDGEASSAPATTAVTIVNRLPIANAGPDRSVRRETTTTLDGRASTDADGTIVSYRWQQIAGPSVRLRNASTAVASFRAPEVKQTTILTFRLTVTDNDGGTATDEVSITVTR